MTFRFTDEAREELLALVEFINRRRMGLGDKFGIRVEKLARQLCRTPQLYSRLRRPPLGVEARRAMVRSFPILIDYQVLDAEIIFLAFTHAKRRASAWRKRTL